MNLNKRIVVITRILMINIVATGSFMGQEIDAAGRSEELKKSMKSGAQLIARKESVGEGSSVSVTATWPVDPPIKYQLVIPITGIGLHPIVNNGKREEDIIYTKDGNSVLFQEKIATKNIRCHLIHWLPAGGLCLIPDANLRAAALGRKKKPDLGGGPELVLSSIDGNRLVFSGRMYTKNKSTIAQIVVEIQPDSIDLKLISIETYD